VIFLIQRYNKVCRERFNLTRTVHSKKNHRSLVCRRDFFLKRNVNFHNYRINLGLEMKRSILIIIVVIAACIGGILGSLVTVRFLDGYTASYQSIEGRQQSVLTRYSTDTSYLVPEELNFLATAQGVTPGVVHIRTS
jgi:hypothetical protein